MNNKYIIKNCPMYFHSNCYGHTGNCYCQDCTDCGMKQIVELCNKTASICKECNSYDCSSCGNYTNSLDKEILQLLEIEECEE